MIVDRSRSMSRVQAEAESALRTLVAVAGQNDLDFYLTSAPRAASRRCASMIRRSYRITRRSFLWPASPGRNARAVSEPAGKEGV